MNASKAAAEPVTMVLSAREIAKALGNEHKEGRKWRCRCPVHGGVSLSLRDGRDELLIKCWRGCDTADVLAELRRRRLIGWAHPELPLSRELRPRQERKQS